MGDKTHQFSLKVTSKGRAKQTRGRMWRDKAETPSLAPAVLPARLWHRSGPWEQRLSCFST